jgi:hypothetical protein
MVKTDTLIELQKHLDWLKSQYEKKYGSIMWDVRCQKDLLGAEEWYEF